MSRTRHRTLPSTFHCLCGKVYAPTKADARRLRSEVTSVYGDKDPVRYYECSRGSWHWTSIADKKDLKK